MSEFMDGPETGILLRLHEIATAVETIRRLPNRSAVLQDLEKFDRILEDAVRAAHNLEKKARAPWIGEGCQRSQRQALSRLLRTLLSPTVAKGQNVTAGRCGKDMSSAGSEKCGQPQRRKMSRCCFCPRSRKKSDYFNEEPHRFRHFTRSSPAPEPVSKCLQIEPGDIVIVGYGVPLNGLWGGD